MEPTAPGARSNQTMALSLETAGTRLFWTSALFLMTCASVIGLLDLSAPWFKPVLYSRMALAFAAAIALLSSLSDRKLPAIFPSVYVLCVLASHSYYAFSVGPAPVLMDLAGVLFLICSLVYRGSMTTWWAMFMPVSMFLLFAPIAKLESSGSIAFGGLLRSSLIPMLSLAGAALVAALRETRGRSLEARRELDRLNSRNRGLVQDLRTLEHDMKSLLTLVRSFSRTAGEETDASFELSDMTAVAKLADSSADDYHGTALSEIEEVSDARILPAAEAVGVDLMDSLTDEGLDAIDQMDPLDIYQVLKETVEEVSAVLDPSKKAQLILDGPAEVSIPMTVRGDMESVRIAIRTLIGLSVDALGGAPGAVRVGLRLGLGQLLVTIEDNGRGFNEEMILKQESRGTMVRDVRLEKSFERKPLADARLALESIGARMEITARLGVGARVVLEFPRIDAFARGRALLHGEMGRAVSSSPIRASYRENARMPLIRSSDQDSRHA